MSVYRCRQPYCTAEVTRAKDVCEDCWDYRRHQLGQLVDLFVFLRSMLAPSAAKDLLILNRARSVAGQAPLNITALDALGKAQQMLEPWAAYAFARSGRDGAFSAVLSHRSTTDRFRYTVSALERWDRLFAATFYAGDYVADLGRVHRRLVTLAAPHPTRKLPIACPYCDGATVITRHTDEYAACLTCAATWAQSQIPALESRQQTRIRA